MEELVVDRSGVVVPWAVVVVDDDDLARDLVVRFFKKLNLRNPIVHARDGDEACAVLAADDLQPALVLLDLQMPNRSGLEVLRWLRGQDRLQGVPVVMLTGSAELDEVEQAYELGIASYLVKPVGYAALQDVILQLGLPWSILPPGAVRS